METGPWQSGKVAFLVTAAFAAGAWWHANVQEPVVPYPVEIPTAVVTTPSTTVPVPAVIE